MSRIILNPDDRRHRLDGKPIYCGSFLELEVKQGVWLPVRYEAATFASGVTVTLHCEFGMIYPLLRSAQFRWPAKQ